MNRVVKVGNISFANHKPIVLIAGPCVVENRTLIMNTAKAVQTITRRLKIPFVFKSSYDKANRTSARSFRGPGIDQGLEILREVKERLGVPVLSDVHSVEEVEPAAKVLDILQIPAFLCRQTDLVVAAATTGKAVNVKKGQFLAPWDMKEVIKKILSQKNHKILLTERGVSFGYNNLVSDFRSLAIMKKEGYPVIFDCSHSVQQPGGLGESSGGKREFIPLLARCAVAAGCSAIFVEVHPRPGKALSDGPNMLPLSQLEKFLTDLITIDTVVKKSIKP